MYTYNSSASPDPSVFHACISRLGERGYWGRKNGWQPNDPLVLVRL